MKSIKAIILFGIIIAIVDVVVILVLNITDAVAQEEYIELIQKSLSIVGLAVLASIAIALIVRMVTGQK